MKVNKLLCLYLHNSLPLYKNLYSCILGTWQTSAAGKPDCLGLEKPIDTRNVNFFYSTSEGNLTKSE